MVPAAMGSYFLTIGEKMFTVESVRELKWKNSEHTVFDCIVKYKEFREEHPAGIVADESYEHIREIWTNGNAGVYGPIAEYEPPENEPQVVTRVEPLL